MDLESQRETQPLLSKQGNAGGVDGWGGTEMYISHLPSSCHSKGAWWTSPLSALVYPCWVGSPQWGDLVFQSHMTATHHLSSWSGWSLGFAFCTSPSACSLASEAQLCLSLPWTTKRQGRIHDLPYQTRPMTYPVWYLEQDWIFRVIPFGPSTHHQFSPSIAGFYDFYPANCHQWVSFNHLYVLLVENGRGN